jgi:hypothetical protein
VHLVRGLLMSSPRDCQQKSIGHISKRRLRPQSNQVERTRVGDLWCLGRGVRCGLVHVLSPVAPPALIVIRALLVTDLRTTALASDGPSLYAGRRMYLMCYQA